MKVRDSEYKIVMNDTRCICNESTLQSSYTSIPYIYVYILAVMVTTTLRDITPTHRQRDTLE